MEQSVNISASRAAGNEAENAVAAKYTAVHRAWIRAVPRSFARLKATATPAGTVNGGEADIAWAAATLGVAEVEVIKLIPGGVLERVAGLANRVGIHALLVRPEEGRAHLEERAYPGLPWVGAAEQLRVSPAALSVLVGSGYLESERAEVGSSGNRTAMVSKESIHAFQHAFVIGGICA
jgi:hypothetical protein